MRYTRRHAMVLAVAIALKLAMSLWNYSQYDMMSGYDATRHVARIGTCGLYATKHFYNQPAYPLLACPLMVYSLWGEVDLYEEVLGPLLQGTSPRTIVSNTLEKVDPVALVKELAGPFLQLINVVMIFLFYYIWTYKIFPHFLESEQSAFFASAFLLALPGYQRLAAMAHPDNLIVFSTTIALYFWLRATRKPRVSMRDLIVMALLLGLLALSRPTAIVPLACLSTAILVRLWREQGPLPMADALKAVASRAFPFLAIVFVIGTSWWGYRYAMTGAFLATWDDDKNPQIEMYRPRAQEFDYVAYYTTFYAGALLEQPNRYLGNSRNTDAAWKASLNNSFFTVFFSDFWGDHWLYFSGPKLREHKTGIKRALLAYAMVLTPFLLLMFVVGLVRSTVDLRRRQDWETWMAVIGTGLLGVLLFVAWQSAMNIEPGINTAIMFFYIAYAVPFLVIVMFRAEPERFVPAWMIEATLAGLFVLAAPVATYWL